MIRSKNPKQATPRAETPEARILELERQLAEARAAFKRFLFTGSPTFGGSITIDTPLPPVEYEIHERLKKSHILAFTSDASLRYSWFFDPLDPHPVPSNTILGRTDAEIFAPTLAKLLGELKQQVLKTHEDIKREITVQTPEGDWIYELSLQALLDAKGDAVGTSGAIVDVTRQRMTDRGMRLLAQTVASTHEHVALLDVQGKILFVNDAFGEQFGHAPEALIGEDISVAGAAEQGSQMRTEIWNASLNQGWQGEWRGKRSDGSVFPEDIWTSPVRNDDGEVVAVVVVGHDISRRKHAERVQSATFQIAVAVSSTENLQDLYRAIHEIVGQLMPAENFYIATLDDATGMLTFPYWVDQMDPTPTPRPQGKGLTEHVIKSGKPLLASPEVFEKLVSDGLVESLGSPSIDWLGVPLATSRKRLGALVIQTYSEKQRFTEEDRDILTFVSTQIALAIERKLADDALRENEQRYRLLYNNTPAMLYSIDAENHIISVSDYWLRVMGYSRSEVIGKKSTDFLTVDSRNFVSGSVIPALFETGACMDIPYQMVKKGGEVIDVVLSAIIERGPDGSVVRSLAVLQDVTEKNRAARDLLESERRYRSLFEDSAISLWEEDASQLKNHLDELRTLGMTNPRSYFSARPGEVMRCLGMFRVVDVNRATLELMGARSKQELKDRFHEIFMPESMAAFTEEIISLAEGKKLFSIETYNRTLDGRQLNVVVRLSVAPGYEESLSKIIVTVMDMTERRNLQERLLHAQKLESIGTLAGGIAHDFNNLLGIILGHASLLPEIAKNPQHLSRSVAAIQHAVDRGASLVRQILTFARKANVTFEGVNLNDVVTEMRRMLAETFPRTITFALNLTPDLPLIEADRTQVHQTLLNLCLNARDAMPEGGLITISTSCDSLPPPGKRFVRCTVKDTGTGMDEETQKRIFEPFFTTKEPGKGSGLGLSVAYGIMESHRGFITVESTPGHGTTFELLFPVPESAMAAEEMRKLGDAELRGNGETLLVVEDEELLADLLKGNLEKHGYTVLTASDGEQALSIFESLGDEITLVISDLGLPRMSGRELFRRIRLLEEKAKVVIATGYIEPEEKNSLLRDGAVGFIHKPYKLEEVTHVVSTALAQQT
jgi:PAS domain S-box-containing protein